MIDKHPHMAVAQIGVTTLSAWYRRQLAGQFPYGMSP